MTKFEEDLEARLQIIGRMIPNARPSERKSLQRERSDLEQKLQKVRAA